jgi:hypothetical protein
MVIGASVIFVWVVFLYSPDGYKQLTNTSTISLLNCQEWIELLTWPTSGWVEAGPRRGLQSSRPRSE